MNSDTIRYLTQDELRALLGSIKSRRDKAIFYLAYRYGLRASEVGMLQRDDIDFDKQQIRINRLKRSISSVYPLHPKVVKTLRAYLRTRKDQSPILFMSRLGNPISRSSLNYLMKKYAAEAGIPEDKRYFHVLKHSIATHLLSANADIMFVKDWLGHKRIQNTLEYAKLINTARDAKARKKTMNVRVRPDAIFTIRFTDTGKVANFFFEADTGSMAHREFYKKVAAYCALYDSGKHTTSFGVGEFRVLTATSSSIRRGNMRSNLQNHWKKPNQRPTNAKNIGRFYFADQHDYRVEDPESILENIFYTMKSREPRSILPQRYLH